VMARVFRELGHEPVRNRIIKFGPTDAELKLDVAAKDHRYGIAYITWQDADRLGDALPTRRDPGAFVVVRGNGDDDDVHAALLFAADYMQDDLAGESRTSTSIAAEQKLMLATRDILRRAEHENWPYSGNRGLGPRARAAHRGRRSGHPRLGAPGPGHSPLRSRRKPRLNPQNSLRRTTTPVSGASLGARVAAHPKARSVMVSVPCAAPLAVLPARSSSVRAFSSTGGVRGAE
jgi:hypothetical protein